MAERVEQSTGVLAGRLEAGESLWEPGFVREIVEALGFETAGPFIARSSEDADSRWRWRSEQGTWIARPRLYKRDVCDALRLRALPGSSVKTSSFYPEGREGEWWRASVHFAYADAHGKVREESGESRLAPGECEARMAALLRAVEAHPKDSDGGQPAAESQPTAKSQPTAEASHA